MIDTKNLKISEKAAFIEAIKNIDMAFIDRAKEAVDNLIFAQPEHVTPLYQAQRIQEIIDKIIIHCMIEK